MDLAKKLQRILPLSAASVALLQSVFSSKADIPNNANPGKGEGEGGGAMTSKTDHLILAPANQDELLQMYAQHSSHASHASHASHYSGAGGGYVAPDYVTPTYPSRAPAAAPPVQSSPPPAAPRPVSPATSLNVNTNLVATSNTPTAISPEQDAANMEELKKQAAAGSSKAQLSLSVYYRYGTHGLKQSEEKADMLLEMSATQGNFVAQNMLKQREDGAEKSEKLEKDSASTDTDKPSTTQ